MGKTKIEWTDETWNPVTGCTKVSAGCKNCYAERVFPRAYGSDRIGGEPGPPGLTGSPMPTNSRPRRFTDVRCHPERLDQPLKWRKPRRVFVNSMSDLFHPDVPDEFIAQVFAVMASAPRHTFQVLTKRPHRMMAFISRCGNGDGLGWITHDKTAPKKSYGGTGIVICGDNNWPLPNVWLGVSVEDQQTADERIPLLLQTPAAVRFISAEPLLGPIDVSHWLVERENRRDGELIKIDWCIAGGESGPHARPAHPDWFRSLRDQCVAADVPFFFKQWGEWAPVGLLAVDGEDRYFTNDGSVVSPDHYAAAGSVDLNPMRMARVGKKRAGRTLDGQEWNQFPR